MHLAVWCALATAAVASHRALAQATTKTKSSPAAKPTKSSGAARATPAPPPAKRPAAPPAVAKTTGDAWVSASANVVLRESPDGTPVATLGAGVPLAMIARDRGWTHVRIDGWVRDDSVQVTDVGSRPISAAELRTDPAAARGKTVRWNVQILAMETADPLHRDLNPDEPYLLARGPGSESTLLYVAVPESLLGEARTLAATAPANIALVATVRVARSQPVGVPILDAHSLVRR